MKNDKSVIAGGVLGALLTIAPFAYFYVQDFLYGMKINVYSKSAKYFYSDLAIFVLNQDEKNLNNRYHIVPTWHPYCKHNAMQKCVAILADIALFESPEDLNKLIQAFREPCKYAEQIKHFQNVTKEKNSALDWGGFLNTCLGTGPKNTVHPNDWFDSILIEFDSPGKNHRGDNVKLTIEIKR